MTPKQIEEFIVRSERLVKFWDGDEENFEVVAALRQAIALLKEMAPEPNSKIPFDDIIDSYHHILPTLAKVSKLTDRRRQQLAARWNEDKSRQNRDWWRGYFRAISRSDFLMGRKPDRTGRAWKADLDFALQPKSMTRVLEGFYGEGNDRQVDLVDSVMNAQRL